MKTKPFPKHQFHDLLNETIHELDRKNGNAHFYYGEARSLIDNYKESAVKSELGIEHEEKILSGLKFLLDAVHEADQIVFDRKAHDVIAITHALDKYNLALQMDISFPSEISSILARRIKKASNILDGLLSKKVEIYEEKPKKIVNKIQIITDVTLTPNYLLSSVSPYIKATVDLQMVLNEMENKEKQDVRILSITQKSPISFSLDGAGEAIRVIMNEIIPWRRKHSDTIERLEEESLRLDSEVNRAETLAKRSEPGNLRNQAYKTVEEARRMQFEYDLLIEGEIKTLAREIVLERLQIKTQKEISIAIEKILPAIKTLLLTDLDIDIKKLGELE